MKIRFWAALVAVMLSCGFFTSQAEARRVMTWVPPYAIAESMTQLKAMHGSFGGKNSITHLALQFWVPTADGMGVQYSTDGSPSDAAVAEFVAWGHANGIKVLLCVYNNVNSTWDWARAKNAFATNRAKFAAALVREVKKHNLDGVDIDFEGLDVATTGEHDGDRPAFVTFLKTLKGHLAKTDRELTVDSFPHIWNAPNTTWWRSILPHVDGLTSMGYEDTGRNAADWGRYSMQVRMAREYPEKLQLGMPSNHATWQGNSATQQLTWVLQSDTGVGIAIWDAQFLDASWRGEPVWRLLRRLRVAE